MFCHCCSKWYFQNTEVLLYSQIQTSSLIGLLEVGLISYWASKMRTWDLRYKNYNMLKVFRQARGSYVLLKTLINQLFASYGKHSNLNFSSAGTPFTHSVRTSKPPHEYLAVCRTSQPVNNSMLWAEGDFLVINYNWSSIYSKCSMCNIYYPCDIPSILPCKVWKS